MHLPHPQKQTSFISRSLLRSIAAGAMVLASAAAAAAAQYPKMIQGAVDSGVKVVKSFPAASGLTGWVLMQEGRHSLIFTTSDGKTAIAGALINENGENLNEQYAEKYIPKPDTAAMFKKLEQSTYITEGTINNPKSLMYVFVDANCPFCHNTWKALQPYEKAGLQVRWILVDTLGPTSMPKAIEVLAAKDKTAAFRKMELDFGKSWKPTVGMDAASKPAVADQIRKNNELLHEFGMNGTPGLVWKDKQGKAQIKNGMPRLSELPAMTGLPEQKNEDPSLERFR